MQDCSTTSRKSSKAGTKLSICISTLNRAKYLRATLDRVLSQATEECEILVLDAASTDGTEELVSEYARKHKGLRYVRQDMNNGFDQDFDRTVELACGEYCWLASDDDFLKPGAVATVLEALRKCYSLVLVNVEVTDETLSRIVWRRCVDIDADRVYGSTEMDELFKLCKYLVTYVGCVVVKRELWLARDRKRYYRSAFIHVGVLFQAHIPGNTLLIAQPLISIRVGNQLWVDKWFDIVVIKLPALIRSLAISEPVKTIAAEPWRKLGVMLFLRAIGSHTLAKYRAHIRPSLHSEREKLLQFLVAVFPRRIANALLIFHYSVIDRRGDHPMLAIHLRKSRFCVANWLFSRSRDPVADPYSSLERTASNGSGPRETGWREH